MNDPLGFLFIVCQVGAEPALKNEIARQWPEFRFAYSRPGFVTFKLPDSAKLTDDFDLHSVFARLYGFSLGKVRGENAEIMAGEVWRLAADREYEHLHVWQRDEAMPGEHGFEPGVTPLAEEIGRIITEQKSCRTDCQSVPLDNASFPVNRSARPGQMVLDCVLVEPNEWWIGFHQAASMPSRWPGGVPKLQLPDDAVSRAYLKMTEALKWSRLPIRKGDLCAEIGSAPGGAAQALLQRGLHVLGIDPAEIEPSVLERPHFTHIKKRGREVRRREFRGVRWLMADVNVAPKYTLDTVEQIVTHEDVHIRGVLLTLKLLDWKLADEIPLYLERIRSWGYEHVKARQLAFNRQEICVAALRHRSMRRFGTKKTNRR